MAVADLDAYRALMADYQQLIPFKDDPAQPVSAGEFQDSWPMPPNAGTTPSTAVVPGRTDTGALGQVNGGGTALHVLGATGGTTQANGHCVSVIVCDRLSHQGGLVGNVTTEQTTNLPTAALTRYTDGVGVMCGLTVYSNLNNTASVATVRYTMDGVGSKVSPGIAFAGPGISTSATGMTHIIPCEAGGRGFQSVEGVTLSVSTGAAGNFGVTLFKPLAMISLKEKAEPNRLLDWIFEPGLHGMHHEILDDACLFILYCQSESFTQFTGVVHLGVE